MNRRLETVPKISCLMPCYNRYPNLGRLVEEAIESFLRQDYENRELIICNDTPGQVLTFSHPRVRIYNWGTRFERLGQKIQFMISVATGSYICRWDDDDISLPHRLSYSLKQVLKWDRIEWRAGNYFYHPPDLIREEKGIGNTHIMSIFHRDVVTRVGGYPLGPAGGEDQAFNRLLGELGVGKQEEIPTEDMYYIYRWGTGSQHLSGKINRENVDDPHQGHYVELGQQPVEKGRFEITPQWHSDYLALAKSVCVLPGRVVNLKRSA